MEVLKGSGGEGIGVSRPAETAHTGLTGGGGEGLEVLTGGGGEGMEVLTGSGEEGIGVALPSGPAETACTGLTGGGGEGLEVLNGVEEVEVEFRDTDLEEQHVVEEWVFNELCNTILIETPPTCMCQC